MGIPQGLATFMTLFGFLLILFAIIDVVCANIFGYDLTGVAWSPIASGAAGGIILRIFGDDDD